MISVHSLCPELCDLASVSRRVGPSMVAISTAGALSSYIHATLLISPSPAEVCIHAVRALCHARKTLV